MPESLDTRVARAVARAGALQVAGRPMPDVLVGAFPAQLAFVNDPAPLSYAFCTRRAAKSYSAALKAIKIAERFPRCVIPIIGMVRQEIKGIYWQLILKELDQKHGLGLRFNETELTATMRNGSVLQLVGADANENEKRKILGRKFPLAVVDEAQDFVTDLEQLVRHVLEPAVTDYRGQICLLGTPGLVARGLFYDVTTGKEPGWTRHEWTAYDNPYQCAQWTEKIAELRRTKPGVEKTAWFRRNYLREWVIDEDALVYRYEAGRNDYQALPVYRAGEWHRVLGIDLGHVDASALVLCAYHDHDPTLYIERVFKQSGMDITAVANQIGWFRSRFDIDVLVVDGANKQAVEEMRRRHNLPLIAADKTGKADFIEIMNAELTIARVKLQATDAAALAQEYAALIWDPKKKDKKEEHAACENHAADAALYAWRRCYPYLSEAEPKVLSEEEKLEDAALARLEAEQEALRPGGVGDSSQWDWRLQ